MDCLTFNGSSAIKNTAINNELLTITASRSLLKKAETVCASPFHTCDYNVTKYKSTKNKTILSENNGRIVDENTSNSPLKNEYWIFIRVVKLVKPAVVVKSVPFFYLETGCLCNPVIR